MTARTPLRTATAGTLIAILAVAVLAVDQFTKYLAITFLPSETLVPVLGDAFGLYLIRNSGAAFSLGAGFTWIFTIALAVVAGVIVYLALRRVHSRAWAVILGLLLGGVLGNLTDRLLREPGFGVGHVVDFINTPWMWFWTSPAIYNVADCFIVTMMIGVAILVLIGLRLDGTRERRETPVADGARADDGHVPAGRESAPATVESSTADATSDDADEPPRGR